MTKNDMFNINTTATNVLPQSIPQLQSNLATSNCCTSRPITVQMGNDYRYLSDIIKYFGDLGIRTLCTDQEYGCIPTMTIEADMYCKKPEKTISDVLENMTANQRKAMDYILGEAVKEKENNKMGYNNGNNNSMFGAFNGMFGKLPDGSCRLSTSGEVAVKTTNGYKYYSTKSKRPVNCDQFVFDVGDDFFFLFPTNKVEAGDILLINYKPKYVIKTEENMITVLNYEDSTVETIIPEQHIFMGNSYYYAKIVSMFGNSLSDSDKGMKKIMRYMMLTEMMKGSNGNGMNSMLPLMLMGNDFGDMFDGLFDFSDKDETEHVNGETNKRTESKD